MRALFRNVILVRIEVAKGGQTRQTLGAREWSEE